VYLAVAEIAFGYWRQANPVAALLVFVPACLTFAALGLVSAAFVLMFKKGDPVIAAYAALNGLVGGAIFPISVLPGWLQPLTGFLPLTHALSGIRLALQGAQPVAVLQQIGLLTITAAALLPAAFAFFGVALARAKREGSIVQY
jgi:ABC-2 type transport system permease protein